MPKLGGLGLERVCGDGDMEGAQVGQILGVTRPIHKEVIGPRNTKG